MSNPMQPVGNPVTAGTPSADRFGGEIGAPYRRYMGGPLITGVMAKPSHIDHCVFVGKAPRAEFLVRVPASVTAFTIHYGRWAKGEKTHASLGALDGWVEIGTKVVTGAAEGDLVPAGPFDSETDAVGAYITGLTGSVDSGKSFQIWVRGLPR